MRFAALALVLSFPPSFVSAADAPAITAVSFNIRYGTARDGENHWRFRKDRLVESIKTLAPELLGTQETLAFQRDFLAERLPGYDVSASVATMARRRVR